MDLDLARYVERLQTQLDGFAQVGGAADLAAVEDGPVTPPAAFVVPLSDAPTKNPLHGEFTQHVVVRFGVVLAVSNLADAAGAAAVSELAARRRQVREALAGWSPDATIGWAQRGPGQLMKFADGLLWWMDEYLTDFYERTELP